MKAPAFVKWLRERVPREDRGVQKRLADAVGVKPAMVSKWASGDSVPEPDKVFRIARHFGVPCLPLVRLAHPELAKEVDTEIPVWRLAPETTPHDCWAYLGGEKVRAIGKLDDGHCAVLEIHQEIRENGVQPHVDNVVISVLEALEVLPKEKAEAFRGRLVARGPWR